MTVCFCEVSMGLDMAASVFWNHTEGLSLRIGEWSILWDLGSSGASYSAMIPNSHPLPLLKLQCFYFGVERYLYISRLQSIVRLCSVNIFSSYLGGLVSHLILRPPFLICFVNVIAATRLFYVLQLNVFCVIFRNPLENPKSGVFTPVFSKKFLFVTVNI